MMWSTRNMTVGVAALAASVASVAWVAVGQEAGVQRPSPAGIDTPLGATQTQQALQALAQWTVWVRLPAETLPQALHFDRLGTHAPPAGKDAGDEQRSPQAVWVPGLVVRGEGLVLLPQPLYAPAAEEHAFEVELPQGGRATAAFVGSDVLTRLTLLRLSDASQLPAAELLQARPALGEPLIFLPADGGLAHMRLWTAGRQSPGMLLRPGRGGAGVLGYITPDAQYVHLADCRAVIEQLDAYGRVTRPMLGVMVQDDTRARRDVAVGGLPPRPRLQVKQVFADSRADRAGVRVGDELVSIEGMPVSDLSSLAAAIAAASGETQIVVRRDGQERTLMLPLHGER